jgi:hypothetical protein
MYGDAIMPPGNEIKEALMKEGGCSLFILAIGAIMVGGFIYYMIVGFGDPEAVKIRNDCWDRETYRIGQPVIELSEDERIYVIRRCDAEVKAYLAAKHQK